MSTATEAELEQLWQEVLGSPPSSPDANFFLDGGNSVAAMKLMGRVRRRWGRQVQLRELFDNPSVRSLSDRIETLTGNEMTEEPGHGG
jgi:aryl carrier-like protein